MCCALPDLNESSDDSNCGRVVIEARAALSFAVSSNSPARRHLTRGRALRARGRERLGQTAVPPLETQDVFNIRLATDREARSLKSAHTELHAVQ